MNRSTKLVHAILWFGGAAVIFFAGYAEGTHAMMETVKELMK